MMMRMMAIAVVIMMMINGDEKVYNKEKNPQNTNKKTNKESVNRMLSLNIVLKKANLIYNHHPLCQQCLKVSHD